MENQEFRTKLEKARKMAREVALALMHKRTQEKDLMTGVLQKLDKERLQEKKYGLPENPDRSQKWKQWTAWDHDRSMELLWARETESHLICALRWEEEHAEDRAWDLALALALARKVRSAQELVKLLEELQPSAQNPNTEVSEASVPLVKISKTATEQELLDLCRRQAGRFYDAGHGMIHDSVGIFWDSQRAKAYVSRLRDK